jgi:D-glycero-alpha-D-manno-heptose-7-phosphate kinase
MRPFLPGIYLKYSRQEMVESIDQVEHPIIAEVLRHLDFKTPQVEITTLADIPSGTGLGSSSSFTTALLKALYAHRRKMILPNELAELACQIEIERLRQPIGKQDQYIAAYGGITCFDFRADGTVEAHPLAVSMDTLFDLEDNLLLFFTGFDRAAGSILKDQDDRSKMMTRRCLKTSTMSRSLECGAEWHSKPDAAVSSERSCTNTGRTNAAARRA